MDRKHRLNNRLVQKITWQQNRPVLAGAVTIKSTHETAQQSQLGESDFVLILLLTAADSVANAAA